MRSSKHVLRIAGVINLLFLAVATCSAQGKDSSTINVQVAVKKGYLVVDRTATSCTPTHNNLTLSDEFLRRSGISSVAPNQCFPAIEKKLFDDLDFVFAQLRPFYWFALTNSERQSDQIGQLNDQLSNAVRSSSDNWQDFVQKKFLPWAANANRSGVEETFSAYFNGTGNSFTNLLANTALIFNSEDADGASTLDPNSGTVLLSIGDPVRSWDNREDFVVCFPLGINDECSAGETPPEANQIRELLKPLRERLWRPGEIRARIEAHYSKQGLIPTVMISAANAAKRYINVQKSPRIGRLIVPGDVTALTAKKLLYGVLSATEFRFFLKHPDILKSDSLDLPGPKPGDPSVPLNIKYVDYLDLGTGRVLGDEPFLNQFRLQSQQLQVAQLNAVITQLSAGGPRRTERQNKSYVDLRIIQQVDSDTVATPKAQANAPKPATPLANNEGVIDPRPTAPEVQNSFVPTSPTVRRDSLGGAPRKNNFLGGGVSYRPEQGVRLLGRYQRKDLGPGNLSLQIGDQSANALGSGNYFSDFAFFETLGHRRLLLQFTGSSDVNANRLLNGVETEERRSGGLMRGELELFRDWKGHLLRVYAEGRRATVELSGKSITTTKQNLTTLEVGGFYLFESRNFQRSLRLQPMLRLGLGLAASEARYERFGLNGNFHQKLSNAWELDFTGSLGLASKNTPVFELPSFGGAEVVRGFRSDAILGRRLWNLQNEFWFPVPGTKDATKGIGVFLQRNVKVAGFIDVGGISQTTTADSGIHAGPGLGLRVIRYPMVLKLDWGYGLGNTTELHNRGRFYFSVSVNSPF